MDFFILVFENDNRQFKLLLKCRAPDPDAVDSTIPEKDLPRCKKGGCGGLLRPAVVWFGEGLEEKDLTRSGTFRRQIFRAQFEYYLCNLVDFQLQLKSLRNATCV